MTTYRCKLVNRGIVREMFCRDGETVEEVRETLEMYHWPKGEWVIEEVGA